MEQSHSIKNVISKITLKQFLIADAVLVAIVALLVLAPAKPDPVGKVTVSESSYNTVSLSWNESDKADGYRVYRSKDNKDFEYIGSTNENKYTDKNLRTGDTYYYSVCARNGVLQSKNEKEHIAEATPSLGVPDVKIDTSKGNVELKISDIDGAIGYEIIRDGEKLQQISETTFTDTAADPDKKHKYEVRAVRYKKNPVYSEASKASEVELHSVPNFTIDVRGDTLHLEWGKSDYYDNYKVYNNEDLITETNGYDHTIKDYKVGETYDIRIVGYSSESSIQSPESERRFQVVEAPMDNKGAINAACEWGVDIANDDSFAYGTGRIAHSCGCYFCGTNIRKKGKKYEKTYCCNPFVHACYAHGAGDPQMLKTCKAGGSVGMELRDYTRYGTWKNLGKPKLANLQRGDVLVRPDHVMLYIGNGDIVHAAEETWGPDGIKVGKAAPFYNKVDFVVRYTGSGSGTMHAIKDVDEDGNFIDPPQENNEEDADTEKQEQ